MADDNDIRLDDARRAFRDLGRTLGELGITARANLTEQEQWVLTGLLVRLKQALGIPGPMVVTSGRVLPGAAALAAAAPFPDSAA